MFDKKIYKETFSSLHASKDILLEVMNMTNKTRKRVRLSRTIALAAIIAALSSVAAMAAVGFIRYENPAAMLNAFFGENVSSGNGIVEYDEHGKLITNLPAWERVPVDEKLAEELIAPYIFAVGQSVKYGEYTLNVEAALFDSSTRAGMIYYTVENASGISGYKVFPDGELWWPAEAEIFTKVNEFGRSYIDTAMSTDTKIYICTYYIAGAEAESIQVGIGSGEDRGNSNDITLELTDGGGMANIELQDGAIKISPVSIQIDEAALGIISKSDISSIILHYADGSAYVLEDESTFVSNHTYSLRDQDISTYTYNRIVDTNNIVSITIEDVKYERVLPIA